MQYNSDIEHVTHLGYQTHATRAYDDLHRCLIRIFGPFLMRDTMQGLYAMQVLCGTYTQGRFCTGPQCGLYARPLHNADFARDLSNTASFLRPFTMLAETSKQILA